MPAVAAVSPMVVGRRPGACAARPPSRSRWWAWTSTATTASCSLRSKVVDGQARLGPGEGIIGRELADDLGVRVGDRVSLVTGSVTDSLRVTALVDLGVRELNRRTVIVPLRAAQSLVGLPGGATALDLALVDVWSAQTLADDLQRATRTRWRAGSRPTRNWCRR